MPVRQSRRPLHSPEQKPLLSSAQFAETGCHLVPASRLKPVHRGRIAEPGGLPACEDGRSPQEVSVAGCRPCGSCVISQPDPIESGSEWRCLTPRLLPSDGANVCSSCPKYICIGIVCQGILYVVITYKHNIKSPA